MNDFVGKRIKVYLNADSGFVCVSGGFVKLDSNFLVIYNDLLKKVQYFSMFYVKNVEIVGDYREEE